MENRGQRRIFPGILFPDLRRSHSYKILGEGAFDPVDLQDHPAVGLGSYCRHILSPDIRGKSAALQDDLLQIEIPADIIIPEGCQIAVQHIGHPVQDLHAAHIGRKSIPGSLV